MSQTRRFVSMVLGAISLLLLGFIVAVAARSRPGATGDDSLVSLDLDLDLDLGRLVGWVVFILAMLGAILFAFGVKQAKPHPDQRMRSILGVVLAVAVFYLVFRYFRPLADGLLGPIESGSAEAGDGGGEAATGSTSAWIFSLLVAAIVAAALTRVGLTVRDAEGDFFEPEIEPPSTVESMSAPIHPRALPLASDPRSRVLNAYYRFEESAGVQGVPRRATETAGRHARRAAKELGLAADRVNALMGRYSRTRFGQSGVTPEDAETAELISRQLTQEMQT